MEENKIVAKIQPDTIVRAICLLIVLINQALVAFGKNPIPFSEDDIYKFLSILATIVVSLWTAWKNNSFTKEAIIADEIMHDLKDSRKAETEEH